MNLTDISPTFTGFDIAVFLIVLISAVAGYARGFVREAFSLLAWAGAAAATYYLFDSLKPYAREIISVQLFADVGTALAIFVVTLVVLSILATNITRTVANSGHSALDRSVGFLFGILRGAIVVCVGYVLISWMVPPPDQPGWMQQAKSMPLIREGSTELQRLLPPDLLLDGRSATQKAEQRMREAAEAERLLRGLNAPTPRREAQTTSAEGSGYKEQERRKLEDLIRGTER